MYTVRNVVERFTKGGDTDNLCAIDVSKAFDKVNHHALFIKLMRRNLPVALLDIPENWFKNCKNGTTFSLIHLRLSSE